MGEDKVEEYNAKFTRAFIFVFVLNLALCGVLVALGRHYNQVLGYERGNNLIILAAVWGFFTFVSRTASIFQTVRLSESEFFYKSGNDEFKCPWSKLSTFEPKGGLFFRSTLLGTKEKTFSIDSSVFEDYDAIVKSIYDRRERFFKTKGGSARAGA